MESLIVRNTEENDCKFGVIWGTKPPGIFVTVKKGKSNSLIQFSRAKGLSSSQHCSLVCGQIPCAEVAVIQRAESDMVKLEPDELLGMCVGMCVCACLYKEIQKDKEFPPNGILGKLQNTKKH